MDFGLLPLPIFPPASLDSSVTTTVWIGVLVVAFFNLRLGWIFSGLVVPGYLVPLILARPISAGVIVLEAIVVYFIAKLISDLSPRGAAWSSLFGRDRFFFLVVVSVLVRLVFDGWALPRVAVALESELGWSLDLGNELHSFGLVIVALMANQLWKPGLLSGMVQMVTTVGITFLIVRGPLMEWTNFDIAALEYMYEDIAASILASPKAYIILLTTAFIASRLNLLYGWEYSGVLIPALLALQWYEPLKLVASLIEAWAVLGVSSVLLESRLFRGATIEKASKVALFFTVSYLYKYTLAFVLLIAQPELKVSDLYGFGYLLPSLLAVKMHEKNIGLRMTRFTVQTTVVSAVVALVVGFGLTLVPRARVEASALGKAVAPAEWKKTEGAWTRAVLDARIRLNAAKGKASFDAPNATEVALFEEAMTGLLRYARAPEGESWREPSEALSALGFEVERLAEGHLLVSELDPSRGWGLYLVRVGEAREILFEAPRPLDEWATDQAAITLYETFEARAVAIAGSGGSDLAGDATRRADHPFQVVHRLFSGSATQVRGAEENRGLRTDGDPIEGYRSSLRVKRQLPEDLDLRLLEDRIGDYSIVWERGPDPSLQWRQSRKGFAELRLSRPARHRVLLAPQASLGEPEPRPYDQPIQGYLHRWLLAGKGRIAERGSEVYQPPSVEDLLFFDEEILTPIVRLVREGYEQGELTEQGRSEWRRIALAAALYDYDVIWYRHLPTEQDYLILQELDPSKRFWGTYVFRLGFGKPYLMSVPRPRSERRTFEVGVSLFEHLSASVFAVAGAHPYANDDLSSDLIRGVNKASLFNLVHQVVLRGAVEEPRLIVLCRAFAETDNEEEPDAMLAFSDGAFLESQLGPLERRLMSTLEDDGVVAKLVDGSRATASYEVGTPPQARYLSQTRDKNLAVLWLSAATRSSFRVDADERLRSGALDDLTVESREADVEALIARSRLSQRGAAEQAEILDLLSYYLESADRLALRSLFAQYPWLRAERVLDRKSPRAFLLLSDEEGSFVAAMNLQLRSAGEPLIARSNNLENTAREFVRRRRALIVAGGPV